MYKPYAVFFKSRPVAGVGLIPFIHYLRFLFSALSRRVEHITYSHLSSVRTADSFIYLIHLGVIADLIRTYRRLLEDILEHTRRNDFFQNTLN